MRYIELEVSKEDLENIQKRKDGDTEVAQGLFGEIELMGRLLEVSPKCTNMSDVVKLSRINRQFEKLEGKIDPMFEVSEDDWTWIKATLGHDKYSSYGPALMKKMGSLFIKINEAREENPRQTEKKVTKLA